MADPGWNLDLKKKYFLSDYSASFSMTPAEIKYVESLPRQAKSLECCLIPRVIRFHITKTARPPGFLWIYSGTSPLSTAAVRVCQDRQHR
jgi:hypothetical protein